MNKASKLLLVAVFALVCLGVGVWVYFAQPLSLLGVKSPQRLPETAPLPPAAPAASVPPAPRIIGVPARIRIESIGVNAEVVPVGLNAKGGQDAPKPKELAYWYKLGPKAGEAIGNTVITGHSYQDGSAVFNNLGALKSGDVITLVLKEGTLPYRVAEMESVSKTRFDLIQDKVYDFTHAQRLVLVTCSGEWDAARRTHKSWTIVYADPAI